MPDKIPVQTEVDKATHQRLQQRMRAEDRSAASVLRVALLKYLERAEKGDAAA